jgi:hypothetical protein
MACTIGLDTDAATCVARIRMTRIVDRTLAVGSPGRPTVVGMAPLEHACFTALTSCPPRLEIDRQQVTHTDITTATLLRYLESQE